MARRPPGEDPVEENGPSAFDTAVFDGGGKQVAEPRAQEGQVRPPLLHPRPRGRPAARGQGDGLRGHGRVAGAARAAVRTVLQPSSRQIVSRGRQGWKAEAGTGPPGRQWRSRRWSSLALPSAAAGDVPGQVAEVQQTVGEAIAQVLKAPEPPPAPVKPVAAPRPAAPAPRAASPAPPPPAARPAAPAPVKPASTARASAAGAERKLRSGGSGRAGAGAGAGPLATRGHGCNAGARRFREPPGARGGGGPRQRWRGGEPVDAPVHRPPAAAADGGGGAHVVRGNGAAPGGAVIRSPRAGRPPRARRPAPRTPPFAPPGRRGRSTPRRCGCRSQARCRGRGRGRELGRRPLRQAPR